MYQKPKLLDRKRLISYLKLPLLTSIGQLKTLKNNQNEDLEASLESNPPPLPPHMFSWGTFIRLKYKSN